jgi:site-specific DNA-methyltransferase (adenine-specific)
VAVLELLTIKIQQMTIESTNDNNSTNPAITYSECYEQVFLGDCLELYKNIEPKSIDLILTDLPYGTTACKWDAIIPFEKLWEMVNYLLKANGAFITTASQPFTSALVMSNPKMFKYEWIWEKTMPNNFCQARYQHMKYHENILVFAKNKTDFYPIMEERSDSGKSRLKNSGKILDGSNNVSSFMGFQRGQGKYREYDKTKINPKSVQKFNSVPNCNGTKLHPTQKPVSLFEYLLKTYSNENMTIFDPCMGSGTTGIACKNLNRNFIGIEKDENYFKIAEQRIIARTLFS